MRPGRGDAGIEAVAAQDQDPQRGEPDRRAATHPANERKNRERRTRDCEVLRLGTRRMRPDILRKSEGERRGECDDEARSKLERG